MTGPFSADETEAKDAAWSLSNRLSAAERERDDWRRSAQRVVDLFDPAKPQASGTALWMVAQAAKQANADMRRERDDARAHVKQLGNACSGFEADRDSLRAKLAEAEASRDFAVKGHRLVVGQITRYAALESAVREHRKPILLLGIADVINALDALTPAALKGSGHVSAEFAASVSPAYDTPAVPWVKGPECSDCARFSCSDADGICSDCHANNLSHFTRRLPIVPDSGMQSRCGTCCYDSEDDCIHADGTGEADCPAYRAAVFAFPKPETAGERRCDNCKHGELPSDDPECIDCHGIEGNPKWVLEQPSPNDFRRCQDCVKHDGKIGYCTERGEDKRPWAIACDGFVAKPLAPAAQEVGK